MVLTSSVDALRIVSYFTQAVCTRRFCVVFACLKLSSETFAIIN